MPALFSIVKIESEFEMHRVSIFQMWFSQNGQNVLTKFVLQALEW